MLIAIEAKDVDEYSVSGAFDSDENDVFGISYDVDSLVEHEIEEDSNATSVLEEDMVPSKEVLSAIADSEAGPLVAESNELVILLVFNSLCKGGEETTSEGLVFEDVEKLLSTMLDSEFQKLDSFGLDMGIAETALAASLL